MSNSAFTPQLIIPTTGVTSGTYGDAFSTLVLTVNNSGQITASTAVPLSRAGGFINKFRNGNFNVAQRGSTGTVGTAGAYTLDGWIITPTGASVTWTQAGNQGNYTSPGLIITGNTSVTDVKLSQRIEGRMVADMFNNSTLSTQALTFQIQISNTTGATITPTLTVKYATALDNGTYTGTDLNAVSLQSVANNAISTVAYSWTPSSPNYTNSVEVTIDFGNNFGTNTKSIQVRLADIRATPGATTGTNNSPPLPEARPIALELPLNQRYYVNTFNPGTAPATGVGVNTQSQLSLLACTTTSVGNSVMWNFPVQMHHQPSMTLYNTVNANTNWRDASFNAGAGTDLTSALFGPFGPQRTLIYVSQAVSAVGNNLSINAAASAEL